MAHESYVNLYADAILPISNKVLLVEYTCLSNDNLFFSFLIRLFLR